MIILKVSVNLYSTETGEIQRFLTSFYNKKIELENDLKWNTEFENPIEMNDMIGTFIENNDRYKRLNQTRTTIDNITMPYNKRQIIELNNHDYKTKNKKLDLFITYGKTIYDNNVMLSYRIAIYNM